MRYLAEEYLGLICAMYCIADFDKVSFFAYYTMACRMNRLLIRKSPNHFKRLS